MKHPSTLSIQEFAYELPAGKIAAYPLAQRDASKLLVYKEKKIQESVFSCLGDFLEKGTLLVFNNARVIRARLHFLNTKGQAIELFCLEPAAGQELSTALSVRGFVRWHCLAGNLKQWRDESLFLAHNGLQLNASLAERKTGYVAVDFSWQPAGLCFAEVLEALGNMPIPPYLKRASEESDGLRYQTVYAEKQGSVAAPTAGLHFTDAVLGDLKKKSVQLLTVTLHVGAGTFKPVKSDTMEDHEMHAEWLEVSLEAIQTLLAHRSENIIAVGTTSLRTLESLYWMGAKAILNPRASLAELEIGQWEPYDFTGPHPTAGDSLWALVEWLKRQGLEKIVCRSQILIAPPYRLKIASGIVTNFHQPQSTLLLLVGAIAGQDWKKIYDYALSHDFRFLSYGDSSLILK